MVFIRNKEENFRRYIEKHFKIILPMGVEMFYAKGVRVGNDEIKKSQINGELGYAACDFGFNPTNSFIQNFGYLAKKNIVRLKEDEAKKFASGSNISMDLGTKSKYVVISFKGYVLGLGYYEKYKKKIINKIPKKRTREIINTF
jgi:NOL1/NOP2/fmu family ribosome biogenesis protein